MDEKDSNKKDIAALKRVGRLIYKNWKSILWGTTIILAVVGFLYRYYKLPEIHEKDTVKITKKIEELNKRIEYSKEEYSRLLDVWEKEGNKWRKALRKLSSDILYLQMSVKSGSKAIELNKDIINIPEFKEEAKKNDIVYRYGKEKKEKQKEEKEIKEKSLIETFKGWF